MKKDIEKGRRGFLKKGIWASLGLSGLISKQAQGQAEDKLAAISQVPPATGKSVIDLKVNPIKQVRTGIIGLGQRGSFHVKLVDALSPQKAMVTALCDIRKEKVDASLNGLKKNKGQKPPATYSGKEDAWKEMVKRDDIDMVLIATPWEWHVPMAVYAMQQGKHVALEVPAAFTVEDCWKLVNTAEETQRNCIMLENVCYGDEELWLLNMVQNEVFGTLTYAEAAYIHDLKGHLLDTNGYYDFWRIKHNIAHDGNLYPTHGLGPVAQYMNILRGDRFNHLVSMSTLEASLSEHAKTLASSHPYKDVKNIKHGDMNNTLIKTDKGRTILLQHDIVTPRPYNRINSLAGTKAFHVGYPSRLAIAGKGHDYLSESDYKEYKTRYQHPIWNKLKKEIEENGGHGGMDFLMMYRLMDCFNNGWPLDMDVYDAAAWSVVTPLSELSVELGSVAVKVPDFTRGKWADQRAHGIIKNV